VCMCVRARALRCADMSYIIKKGTKNFWSRIGDHVEWVWSFANSSYRCSSDCFVT